MIYNDFVTFFSQSFIHFHCLYSSFYVQVKSSEHRCRLTWCSSQSQGIILPLNVNWVFCSFICWILLLFGPESSSYNHLNLQPRHQWSARIHGKEHHYVQCLPCWRTCLSIIIHIVDRFWSKQPGADQFDVS